MNAMRNASLPTQQAIQQWTFNELKDEFVGKQSSKARKSTFEGGDLTVMQSFSYLNSVLDRFEQLMNCPVKPSQKDVAAIKTVFQTRLDAITSANVPGNLLGLKSIFDRVRSAMPTPRGRPDDLPFHEVVVQDLRCAASEFFKFFSACKSGAFGSFLFCLNVCVVFYSSYMLFDAIDVAGHGNHQPRSAPDRRGAGRGTAVIRRGAGGGVVRQPGNTAGAWGQPG